MKEGQSETIAKIQNGIEEGIPAPMMSDYYFRLRSIDTELGNRVMPINKAMRQAIEVVMSHYAYRRPPRTGKLSA